MFGNVNNLPEVQPEAPRLRKQCTPITIVTGWLGSGKTSFLTHVLESLRSENGKKIAIIQNEASASGVEQVPRLLEMWRFLLGVQNSRMI